jgi:hypothetical protein
MAMAKRKIRLEDGRYLIYFEFDRERAGRADASAKKAVRSISERRVGGK